MAALQVVLCSCGWPADAEHECGAATITDCVTTAALVTLTATHSVTQALSCVYLSPMPEVTWRWRAI